ncbi:polysaccharide biosynthesis/export family protein [Erythrobacter sp. MTPC3]|uniref:polysaccharide biosynthesis/export family protein n=1 Tax=Erythrobacter sp. MTPC3 TaxID=3056564 RepID=UPI0036F2D1D6
MKFPSMFAGLAAASILLAGCAGSDRTLGAAPDVEIADLTTLPVPSAAQTYLIGPQERVDIAVVGAETLSGTFLTDRMGNLQYPLLGTLPVAGMSPSEASRMIEDGLRGDYLRNPQVRLIPQELPVNTISIGGEVENPGSYPASGSMSLLRAVNLAGGLGDYARYDEVLVMRTVEGRRFIGIYNIQAIQRGNYADPQLYPDDIVMVGDSPERRRLDRLVSIGAPFLSTAAVIISQVAR